MAHIKVDLSKFAETLGARNQREMKRLQEAAFRGVMRAIPMLVADSPVDTGLYAQSWRAEKTEDGCILGNIAPHAAIIEYGARPFTPPIGPLLAWAKRVLNDGSQPGHYSSDVWALAKHVQQLIQERGILPKHILENSIPKILELIKDEYEHGSDSEQSDGDRGVD